jgi:hypothetical protein
VKGEFAKELITDAKQRAAEIHDDELDDDLLNYARLACIFSAASGGRQPVGLAIQQSISDSCQPVPFMLTFSWAGNVPSTILR